MKSSTSKIIFASLLVGTFAVVNLAFASTTIGTDINTDGNLTTAGLFEANGPTSAECLNLPDQGGAYCYSAQFGPDLTDFDDYTQSYAANQNAQVVVDSILTNPGDYSASFYTQSNTSGVTALGPYAVSLGENTSAIGMAAFAWTQASGANPSANTIGFQVGAGVQGSGSVGEIDAINVPAFAQAGNSLLHYGLHIEDLNGHGSTESAAIKIDGQTVGPNNYAIKTGLGKVSFGDKVGIGTTTPQSLLHVDSGSSGTTTVDFGDQYSSASKACFNTKNTAGTAISFYFVGTSMVVEANRCK